MSLLFGLFGSAGRKKKRPPGTPLLLLTVSPQTCFQDTGLTTPCTVGSTVKGWKDASGNAINFTQSLALTTDRTLQQDAGGKYYLSLGGGANDFLGAAANALFNNAVGGCVGLACRPSVQAISLFTPVSFGTGTSNDTFMLLRGDGTALPNTKWNANVTGGGVSTNAIDSVAYTSGSDVRIMGRADPVTLQTVRLWKNGSQVASTARTAAMTTAVGRFDIGAQAETASDDRQFIGRIYGVVAYNTDLSDANATLLDTYLRGLMP